MLYQFQRDAGDPDYIKLWKRIDNEPETTMFATIADGLKMLREGR